jgi:Na+-driven multidrug efflux pump
MRFHMAILMPSFAIGNAAATLVGQNLGAGKPQRAQTASWLATISGIAITLGAAAPLFFFAPYLVHFFSPNAEVVAIGTSYLHVVSFFHVFAAVAIIQGRALTGAGDTMAPMIITIVSLWGVQVPLAVLLSRVIQPPTLGIWWAVVVAITCHGLLTMAWFQTGKWKTKRLE